MLVHLRDLVGKIGFEFITAIFNVKCIATIFRRCHVTKPKS